MRVVITDPRYDPFFPCWDVPVGTMVVVRGVQKIGHLWWRKSKPVWAVIVVTNVVESVGGHVDIQPFWRLLSVYNRKSAALRLVREASNA